MAGVNGDDIVIFGDGDRNMRLATVCARTGSKRLPGKNTRMLPNGLTLLDHTLWYAQISQCFDDIVLSTDIEGARMYESGGIIVVERPPELATDTAGKVPVIRHALLEAERMAGKTYDQIVDLDVTAPLRTLDDIRGFCAKLDTIQGGGLVSVTPSRKNAYFNQVCVVGLKQQAQLVGRYEITGRPVLRAQDAFQTYDMNASMTAWTRDYLLDETVGDHPVSFNTYIYEMPRERSWDIDDEHDLEIVEFLMSKQREIVVGTAT